MPEISEVQNTELTAYHESGKTPFYNDSDEETVFNVDWSHLWV